MAFSEPHPTTATRCWWWGPGFWARRRGGPQGLFPACPVTVLARHDHQAEAAAACGADHVVRTDAAHAHFEELARLSGARVVGRKAHVMLMGGFPYVIEAVGAPQSVTEALRAVAHPAPSYCWVRPA